MKRLYVILLAALVVAAPLAGAVTLAPAAAAPRVDAATGATPNYRTFLESDLKSMQKVDPVTYATGGLEGGHYTCLKSQPPYTYFEQDWFGVQLAYLLDIEVGMKADTTAVKFIAADGYHVTLTLNEIRNANPNGLYSMLGWKKGAEGATGGPLTELDDEEGPFRLIVPQDPNIGPYPAGTPNWQKAVMQVRAIEVQPVQTGLPPVVPESIPPGQIVVFGNILSHHTFTVDKLKSIDPVSQTYHWKSNLPEYGTDDCTGILVPRLLDDVVGVLDTATGFRAWAGDGFNRNWPIADMRKTFPVDNAQFMLAWNIDGTDLTPAPGDGPIRIIKPQDDPEETNLSRWVRNIRAVQLYVDPVLANEPLGFDSHLVPNDRVIVAGPVEPNNVPSMWYLAEGYTGGGFEEWICINNPNPWQTHVIVNYQIEDEAAGAAAPQELDVAPFSRTSINVNEQVGPDKDVSATVEGYHDDSITVERAMYWNGRDGGHCAAAVSEPWLTWYLAEGSTAGGFETWITLLNPGTKEADAQLTYMTPGGAGAVAGPLVKVPAGGRKTVSVADKVPNTWSVSTKVVSDEPVVAERSMYWNGREGGTCAAGVQVPGTEWFMAEGATAGGFETWVVVQNPNNTKANVTVTYMNADGPIAGPKVEVAANSRETIEVSKTVPNDYQVSTKVTSDKPIVAERAVYWNGREGGTSNTAVPAPMFKAFLAEGATAFGFESWITIQNPGASDATVYITYLTAEGAVERAPLAVKAGERETVEVAQDVPNNGQVSATLSSNTPVVVERAMYWDGRIEGSCSGGYQAW